MIGASKKRAREDEDEDIISQSSQTVGALLVDEETYTRIVDPACSECDDGGTSLDFALKV